MMKAYEKENGFRQIELVIETYDEFKAIQGIMDGVTHTDDEAWQEMAQKFDSVTAGMGR